MVGGGGLEARLQGPGCFSFPGIHFPISSPYFSAELFAGVEQDERAES